MICWVLRGPVWRWLAPALAICLVATGWLMILPRALPGDDDPPAFAPLAQDHPNAALAETTGVRMEKPAQLHRPSFKKPETGARIVRLGASPTVRATTGHRPSLWNLPRRQLFSVQSILHLPDDSADPFPS
jgi:hypothetical protein